MEVAATGQGERGLGALLTAYPRGRGGAQTGRRRLPSSTRCRFPTRALSASFLGSSPAASVKRLMIAMALLTTSRSHHRGRAYHRSRRYHPGTDPEAAEVARQGPRRLGAADDA